MNVYIYNFRKSCTTPHQLADPSSCEDAGRLGDFVFWRPSPTRILNVYLPLILHTWSYKESPCSRLYPRRWWAHLCAAFMSYRARCLDHQTEPWDQNCWSRNPGNQLAASGYRTSRGEQASAVFSPILHSSSLPIPGMPKCLATARWIAGDFQKVWIDTLLARRCSLFGCWRHFDRKTLNSACHTRRRTLSDSIGFSSRWDPLHHFEGWIAHFW